MKDWQKSFIGGLIIGSFGVVPLLFWLAEISVKFRCPSCDEEITIRKAKKQIVPQLKTHQESDENSEGTTKISIATAPTV